MEIIKLAGSVPGPGVPNRLWHSSVARWVRLALQLDDFWC